MKTPHPHKDLIIQWAEDTSLKIERRAMPEGEWQHDSGWQRVHITDLVVTPGYEYRFAPKMISLNGFEYPEPLSSAPPKGTVVWTTWVRSVESIVFSELNESAMAMLKQRRLHLTREAAEMHFEAQIKAGGGEV
jgi:hypothetical protein